MNKRIIRTSIKGWENGSGWTYGPDIYDEFEVTNSEEEMQYSSVEYFDFLFDSFNRETYDFKSSSDTLWIRELIEFIPDPEFPDIDTIEKVLYHAEGWEKDLIREIFDLD